MKYRILIGSPITEASNIISPSDRVSVETIIYHLQSRDLASGKLRWGYVLLARVLQELVAFFEIDAMQIASEDFVIKDADRQRPSIA